MRSRRAALAFLAVAVACAAAYAAAAPPMAPAVPAPVASVAAPSPVPVASTASAPRQAPAPPAFTPAVATKHAACTIRGALPDPACTPGAVMTTDLDVICDESTRDRRHVDASVHKAAFTEYGFTFPPHAPGAFEVDHLIPLELGGDNAITNLWPQPADPRPGFHEKDHVEDYLHREVCSGAMPLDEAQRIIATDWLAVWRRIGGATGDDGTQ